MDWAGIKLWRKAERERLIEARLAMPAEERVRLTEPMVDRLDAEIGDPAGQTVGLYWPFRGELDLRPWMASLTARGAMVALPVVIEKAMPLVFRAYAPGDRLEKGVWNIPIPADGPAVTPTVVVSPLVGFDAENYRLGYGGGFYDRTLAAMPKKPLVIGIGYEFSRLPTIHPQAHDIPMDRVIVV